MKSKNYFCNCGFPVKVKKKEIRDGKKIVCKECGRKIPPKIKDKIRADFMFKQN